MKKNPVATITFSNGSVIQIELYPDIAPNAVTSFIYLAKQGVYDHYPIERIVPGWVLDMSYHAFHNPKACYFSPNDVKSGKYLDVNGAVDADGTVVQQYEFKGTNAQKWKLEDAGEGYVILKAFNGTKIHRNSE